MWNIYRSGKGWNVALDGVQLRASFATFDAALQYTTSDEDETASKLDTRTRSQVLEG